MPPLAVCMPLRGRLVLTYPELGSPENPSALTSACNPAGRRCHATGCDAAGSHPAIARRSQHHHGHGKGGRSGKTHVKGMSTGHARGACQGGLMEGTPGAHGVQPRPPLLHQARLRRPHTGLERTPTPSWIRLARGRGACRGVRQGQGQAQRRALLWMKLQA